VGPNPPSSLIERISEAWQKTVDAPDQIVQMVRLIVQSSEFMQSRGVKIKRPLALMASYVRIMGYDFTPSEGLFNQLSNSGQRLYGWPMPTGLPDDNSLFLGSNAMRNRWNLMLGLAQNAWGNGAPDATKTMETWGGKIGSGSETVAEWFRLFGTNNDDKLIETTLVASGILPFAPLGGNDNSHLAMASAIAAMSPEFQMC
jgi:uncharacterized protein (DUF1800 family)